MQFPRLPYNSNVAAAQGPKPKVTPAYRQHCVFPTRLSFFVCFFPTCSARYLWGVVKWQLNVKEPRRQKEGGEHVAPDHPVSLLPPLFFLCCPYTSLGTRQE